LHIDPQEKGDIYALLNFLPLDAARASQSIMQLKEVFTTPDNVTCFLTGIPKQDDVDFFSNMCMIQGV
jgi:hypothetical protein